MEDRVKTGGQPGRSGSTISPACCASAVADPARNQPISENHSQVQSRVRKETYRPPAMQIQPET